MSIAETAAGGKIWLGTLGAGLFSLENGRATSTRVHLLVRSRRLSESMSEYLIGRIEGHPRIEIHYLSQIVGLSGTAHLENVEWRDDTLGANITRAIRHVFVMAGAAPHAEWLEDFFVLDKSGFIATGSDLAQYTNFHWQLQRNPFLLETSVPGIFAVGDARSGSVKRVASAVGEGSMAVHLVHRFLAECEEQLAVESTPQLMAERTPV
jgi:thioredoxin reductase (NADPH)